MTYEFRCTACPALWTEMRPMAESGEPSTCPHCGTAGRRRFSAVRINTNRWGYDSQPVGISGLDVAERRKEYDREYDRQWAGAKLPDMTVKPMRDIHKELHGG